MTDESGRRVHRPGNHFAGPQPAAQVVAEGVESADQLEMRANSAATNTRGFIAAPQCRPTNREFSRSSTKRRIPEDFEFTATHSRRPPQEILAQSPPSSRIVQVAADGGLGRSDSQAAAFHTALANSGGGQSAAAASDPTGLRFDQAGIVPADHDVAERGSRRAMTSQVASGVAKYNSRAHCTCLASSSQRRQRFRPSPRRVGRTYRIK